MGSPCTLDTSLPWQHTHCTWLCGHMVGTEHLPWNHKESRLFLCVYDIDNVRMSYIEWGENLRFKNSIKLLCLGCRTSCWRRQILRPPSAHTWQASPSMLPPNMYKLTLVGPHPARVLMLHPLWSNIPIRNGTKSGSRHTFCGRANPSFSHPPLPIRKPLKSLTWLSGGQITSLQRKHKHRIIQYSEVKCLYWNLVVIDRNQIWLESSNIEHTSSCFF